MPPSPTGFPTNDAQDDFSRARRRQAVRRLGRRFERGGADIDVILRGCACAGSASKMKITVR